MKRVAAGSHLPTDREMSAPSDQDVLCYSQTSIYRPEDITPDSIYYHNLACPNFLFYLFLLLFITSIQRQPRHTAEICHVRNMMIYQGLIVLQSNIVPKYTLYDVPSDISFFFMKAQFVAEMKIRLQRTFLMLTQIVEKTSEHYYISSLTQPVVGSIVWAFCRLKKLKSRETSAHSDALQSVCIQLIFFSIIS